jgi:hypothetical protein
MPFRHTAHEVGKLQINPSLTNYHKFAVFLHNHRRTTVELRPSFGPIFATLQTDSEQNGAMSSAGLKYIGFTDPRQRRERRRAVALAQLIATIALVLSIAVSAAVVGIARACAPVAPTSSTSHLH